MRVRFDMFRLQRRRRKASRFDGSSETRTALARTAALAAAGLMAAGALASAVGASTQRTEAAPRAVASATHVAAAAPVVSTAPTLRLSRVGDRRAVSRAIFVFTGGLGLLLVLASTLPLDTLRPPIVHEIVMLHRLDLALFGGSLLALVAALYLLTG